jgi:hypothetical protein
MLQATAIFRLHMYTSVIETASVRKISSQTTEGLDGSYSYRPIQLTKFSNC